MNKPLQLRCKTKSGQHYLTGLTLKSTIGRLKEIIAELTKIKSDRLKVLQGYPPKEIDLSDEASELSSLPFRSGDTLIVEESKESSAVITKPPSTTDVLLEQMTGNYGILTRRVVPADNSCLFTSINAVLNSGQINLSCSSHMRQIIASVVKSDSQTYSHALLGKSNKDYCSWISKDDSWGGGIEISILSKYHSVEIDVVDTQSSRIDRFGEDQNYAMRVFLVYDGVHYDPLVFESAVDPNLPLQTMFPSSDIYILQQAMEIAEEAKLSKQYTDVQNFSLKCLICQLPLKGQIEAQSHAQNTGHINFGELK